MMPIGPLMKEHRLIEIIIQLNSQIKIETHKIYARFLSH